MKKKILNQKGETMTEVLVAALVIALAVILLANMVTASYRIITRSEKAFGNYYAARNQMEIAAEASDGTVTIDSAQTGSMAFDLPAGGLSDPVDVYIGSSGADSSPAYTFIRYQKKAE